MYSRFPLSMENLPRSGGFLCLSLRFGCVLTALLYIVYSTLGLAACVAALEELNSSPDRMFRLVLIIIGSISHGISFVLSFILLLGVLKESARCVHPWILWTTFQTLANISIFVVTCSLQMLSHFVDNSYYVYLVQFFVLGAMVYMVVLVASYYKQLVAPQDKKDSTKQHPGRDHVIYVQV